MSGERTPTGIPDDALSWAAELLGPVRGADVVYRLADRVTCRVVGADGTGYLKIAPDLAAEAASLARIDPVPLAGAGLRIPALLGHRPGMEDAPDAMLTGEVPGIDLTHLLDRPELVVRVLSEALSALHALAPQQVLPGSTPRPGQVVVHGDACLPNVMTDATAAGPAGFVDVGDMHVSVVEEDLAAACWSLRFNLGTDWAVRFLEHHGYSPCDEPTVHAFAERYESGERP